MSRNAMRPSGASRRCRLAEWGLATRHGFVEMNDWYPKRLYKTYDLFYNFINNRGV